MVAHLRRRRVRLQMLGQEVTDIPCDLRGLVIMVLSLRTHITDRQSASAL